jgi:hypothetical protein
MYYPDGGEYKINPKKNNLGFIKSDYENIIHMKNKVFWFFLLLFVSDNTMLYAGLMKG